MNPYLFVVGCPRSGTTLLQRMLDSHPLLAVSNDPHFIPFVLGADDGENPSVTQELVERIVSYRTFRRLGIEPDTVRRAAGGSRTYAELVSAIYDAFGEQRGKPLAGEKTPRYVRFLPFLHRLFPWARVLHIVRDGRDVALSFREWAREDRGPGRFRLWRDSPVAVYALFWRWHVIRGRVDGARLGPDVYREVRYEELVSDPEPVLASAAEHLGVPFDEAMVRFHEGRRRCDDRLSAKSAWLPPTPGLREWRQDLAPRDVELFEALAGEALDGLGYERRYAVISPDVRAAAALYAAEWRKELLERHGRLAGRLSLELEPVAGARV